MKTLRLSTQLLIILLISLVLIPIMVIGFAYPEYQKGVANTIFARLEDQLDLKNQTTQEFIDSVLIISPTGAVDVAKIKTEDQYIPNEALSNIMAVVVSAEPGEHRGSEVLSDYSVVYFSFKKYIDDSSMLVFTTSYEKDTFFGNEESLQFISLIFACIAIPIVLILMWFAYVSKSIQSIQRSVNETSVRPVMASKELSNLQESIEIFKAEIREDTEQKQRLFQNISHELKTPITTIKMYAEGIEDGIFKDGDIKNSTQIIKSETDELLARVTKIMDINKLYHVETKAISLRMEKIILSETIFENLGLYEKRAPQVKFHAQLERFEWVGNKELWTNILQNIFDNNIKHGAKNIFITLKKNELVIENDGEKIEDHLLQTLFAAFTKGENGNFGLGLNIVQRSLILLGYAIEVKNTEKGVVYRIFVR